MPYISDPSITRRVAEYVAHHNYNTNLDIIRMADELQEKYIEYTRRKKKPFRTSVKKAYLVVLNKGGLKYEEKNIEISSSSDDDEKIEKKQIRNEAILSYTENQITNLYKRQNIKPKKHEDIIDLSLENGKENLETNQETDTPLKKRKLDTATPLKSTKSKSRSMKIDVLDPPSVTFKDIGGMNDILEKIAELLFPIRHEELCNTINTLPIRGILLHGPSGCGKTLLANAIAGELRFKLIKMAGSKLLTGASADGGGEEKIRKLFEEASNSAPCVLFIDEINVIASTKSNSGNNKEMDRRLVSQLINCFDELESSENRNKIIVIGTTNNPDNIDTSLRQASRFDIEICLKVPNERAREHILKLLTTNVKMAEDVNIKLIARNSPGYVGADLKALIKTAFYKAVKRLLVENNSIQQQTELTYLEQLTQLLQDDTPMNGDKLENFYLTMNDFNNALSEVKPLVLKAGSITVPNTTWEDVGSLQNVKKKLRIAILAPIQYPNRYKSLGFKTSAGVLLFGPPGCGKTLLAKAIANEAGINFMSVKGPELLNMYVGESEKAVRTCFQKARYSAPCVIFFDEIDSMCPRRSASKENDVSTRVVSQILIEMDGIEKREGVFVLAATNRPDVIDPALMRPGRLGKILYVGLPLKDDRFDILRTLTKNGTEPKLDTDIDLPNLARSDELEGYTGADLAGLVNEASELALEESMMIDDKADDAADEPVLVAKRHFIEAMKIISPSVSEKDQKHYEKLKKLYTNTNTNNIENNMTAD